MPSQSVDARERGLKAEMTGHSFPFQLRLPKPWWPKAASETLAADKDPWRKMLVISSAVLRLGIASVTLLLAANCKAHRLRAQRDPENILAAFQLTA